MSVFYKVEFSTKIETEETIKREVIVGLPEDTEPTKIKEMILGEITELLFFEPGENQRAVEHYNGMKTKTTLDGIDWKLAQAKKWEVDTSLSLQEPEHTTCRVVMAVNEEHAQEIAEEEIQELGVEHYFGTDAAWGADEFDRIENVGVIRIVEGKDAEERPLGESY
jgi:hypothetical protein